MKTERFGGLLLATGVAVGVAAVVGIVTGFEPSRLPPALLDIAVYKLTVAAAAGLLAAGAIVLRYAKRNGHQVETDERPLSLGASDPPRLPDAPAPGFTAKSEESADLRVPRKE
jgi:hypothetical protein